MEAFGQESIANLMPLVVDVLENLDSSLSDNKVGGRVPRTSLSPSPSLPLPLSLSPSPSPSPSRPLSLPLNSLSLTIRWVGGREEECSSRWVGGRERRSGEVMRGGG